MRNSNEMTMEKTHRTLEHILKSHKDVQRPRSHGQIMVQCDETGNGQRIFSKTFKIRFAKTRRWNGLSNSRKCFPMDIKKSQQNKGFNKIFMMVHNLWVIKMVFILGGDSWTGSISRTEPSSWIIVFCVATNSATTKFEKYVQRTYSRWKCSIIHTCSKSRRSQFMGRPRCSHAQCSFDRFNFLLIH